MNDQLAARIAISSLDFSDALWCVVAAQRTKETTMDTGVALRALRSTAIISYSRPFTPSNGTEPVKKLKVADLPALKLTAEEARLHQHVVEVLRHKIIAHSDNDFRQVTKVIVKGWGGNPEVRFQQQVPVRMVMDVDLIALGNLCGKALVACSGFIFEPTRPDSAAQLLAPRPAFDLPGYPGEVRSAG